MPASRASQAPEEVDFSPSAFSLSRSRESDLPTSLAAYRSRFSTASERPSTPLTCHIPSSVFTQKTTRQRKTTKAAGLIYRDASLTASQSTQNAHKRLAVLGDASPSLRPPIKPLGPALHNKLKPLPPKPAEQWSKSPALRAVRPLQTTAAMRPTASSLRRFHSLLSQPRIQSPSTKPASNCRPKRLSLLLASSSSSGNSSSEDDGVAASRVCRVDRLPSQASLQEHLPRNATLETATYNGSSRYKAGTQGGAMHVVAAAPAQACKGPALHAQQQTAPDTCGAVQHPYNGRERTSTASPRGTGWAEAKAEAGMASVLGPSDPSLRGVTETNIYDSAARNFGASQAESAGSLPDDRGQFGYGAYTSHPQHGDNSFRARESSTPKMESQARVGLRNFGNTCFVNSILQCLRAVPEFVAAIQNAQVPQGRSVDDDRGTGALAALADLFRRMQSASPGAYFTPSRLLAVLSNGDARWGANGQQDAQEFLHSLLEMLQLDMLATQQPPRPQLPRRPSSFTTSEEKQINEAWQREVQVHSTAVDAVFGGLLQSTICCSVCGSCSHNFEYFLDLSIPLPQRATSPTLQGCLAAFTAEEHLPASEGYFCASCKRCQAVSKRLQLARLPPVLVLHLKRFSNATSFRSCLSTLLKDTVPLELIADGLDLSGCCSLAAALGVGHAIYDLVSVCHHSGTLTSGHYRATCRELQSGGCEAWLDYNDTQVNDALPPRGFSKSAYLLFYRLRSVSLGQKSRPS